MRTKVIRFNPGMPKKCSANVLPDPPENTGLEKVTTGPVTFNEYGVYKCKNGTKSVTNDGFEYKLKCRSNGRFQNRKWLTCRERVTCTKSPPVPPAETGLKLSQSRNVKELDHAIYECKGHPYNIIPSTEDGKFRVPCQKSANFQQAARTKWDKCIEKPKETCESFPATPDGYRLVGKMLPYAVTGQLVEFECEDSGYLAGTSSTASYICQKKADGTLAFVPHSFKGSTPPKCVPRAECPTSTFPKPPTKSGLFYAKSARPLKELEFLEYPCDGGASWKLQGEYTPSQFDGTDAKIVDGKLRVYCGLGGKMGQVKVWPTCRDTSIKYCVVNGTSPDLPVDLKVDDNHKGDVVVSKTIKVVCKDDSLIHDRYRNMVDKMEILCGYTGQFLVPSNLGACRVRRKCPVTKDQLGVPAELEVVEEAANEMDWHKFKCADGKKTLKGTVGPFVKDGILEYPCKLDNEGKFIQINQWPTCNIKKDSCPAENIGAQFVTSTKFPLNVGEKAIFKCANPSSVLSTGKEFAVECQETGLLQIPLQLPTCKAPAECQQSPVPDFNSTYLRLDDETKVKEWDYATYSCANGKGLPDTVPTENVEDGKFKIQCGAGGAFPSNIDWPQCKTTHCVGLQGLLQDSQVYALADEEQDTSVPVGTDVEIKCKSSMMVMLDSLNPIVRKCLEDGTLGKEAFPECRRRAKCEDAPEPIDESKLVGDTNNPHVVEFEYALFRCEKGSSMQGDSDDFKVQCLKGGKYPKDIKWPSCKMSHCVGVPGGYEKLESYIPKIGEEISLKCKEAGKVTDLGSAWPQKCNEDGQFSPPPCRPAVDCKDPVVPSGYKLKTKAEKEFDLMEFQVPDNHVSQFSEENIIRLRCPKGGDPSTIQEKDFPQIKGAGCKLDPIGDFIPAHPEKHSSGVVYGNGTEVIYKCKDPSMVPESGTVIKATCKEDEGAMTLKNPDEKCRNASSCTVPSVDGHKTVENVKSKKLCLLLLMEAKTHRPLMNG